MRQEISKEGEPLMTEQLLLLPGQQDCQSQAVGGAGHRPLGRPFQWAHPLLCALGSAGTAPGSSPRLHSNSVAPTRELLSKMPKTRTAPKSEGNRSLSLVTQNFTEESWEPQQLPEAIIT